MQQTPFFFHSLLAFYFCNVYKSREGEKNISQETRKIAKTSLRRKRQMFWGSIKQRHKKKRKNIFKAHKSEVLHATTHTHTHAREAHHSHSLIHIHILSDGDRGLLGGLEVQHLVDSQGDVVQLAAADHARGGHTAAHAAHAAQQHDDRHHADKGHCRNNEHLAEPGGRW